MAMLCAREQVGTIGPELWAWRKGPQDGMTRICGPRGHSAPVAVPATPPEDIWTSVNGGLHLCGNTLGGRARHAPVGGRRPPCGGGCGGLRRGVVLDSGARWA